MHIDSTVDNITNTNKPATMETNGGCLQISLVDTNDVKQQDNKT